MSLLSWITGYDEENAARAAATDQGTYRSADGRVAEATSSWQQRMRDEGIWSEAEYLRATEDVAAANYDAQPERIDETFTTAVKDNAASMASGVKSGLNAVAGTVWSAIPWWLIIVGLVALFIYLGGGMVLRSRIQKLA